MQPVVELRMLKLHSYTYAIRAPRSGGVVPAHSYVDSGFETLSQCVLDAARALGPNFPRVYVRYQGLCVGERDVSQLRRAPEAVASELVAEYIRLVSGGPAADWRRRA